MPASRRMVVCMNCRERKPHAAHGLCYACRKRTEREQDEVVDPHGPGGLSKDQLRLIHGFDRVLDGCAKLRVREGHLRHIRAILDPYLQPVQRLLNQSTPEYAGGGPAGSLGVDAERSDDVDEQVDGDGLGEVSVTDSPAGADEE